MEFSGNLNPSQLDFFNSQGYLVLESFASKDEVESMRMRMDHLFDQFDCSTSVIFSTKDYSHAKDKYFFDSAENVSFFFEGTRQSNAMPLIDVEIIIHFKTSTK